MWTSPQSKPYTMKWCPMSISSLSDERIQVLNKVMAGDLSADVMSMEELEFIEQRLYELVEERMLEEAMDQGKIVFSGVVDGLLN